MQPTARKARPLPAVVFATLLATLLLEGCASGAGGGGGSPRMAAQGALKCPAGFTVTCEVRKIGRIHHGSFGKNYDSCACVSDSDHARTAPVIPRL